MTAVPCGVNTNSSLMLEDLCPGALPSSQVSPDPFLLSGLLPSCFFAMLPWKCCLHPSLVLPASIPGPAASECPQPSPWGTAEGLLVRPQLPSLQTLVRTLLKDEKRAGGRLAPPGLFRPCPCLGVGVFHQASACLGAGSRRDNPP